MARRWRSVIGRKRTLTPRHVPPIFEILQSLNLSPVARKLRPPGCLRDPWSE